MADLAAAYAEARRRLVELVERSTAAELASPVPACPGWTVRDLLAHVTGVAADAVRGRYFLGAVDAWRDERLASARDAWTAAQVGGRARPPGRRPGRGVGRLGRHPGVDAGRALAWDGNPDPYLDLLSPYPLPASPLLE